MDAPRDLPPNRWVNEHPYPTPDEIAAGERLRQVINPDDDHDPGPIGLPDE
jgi:hypothetical protein